MYMQGLCVGGVGCLALDSLDNADDSIVLVIGLGATDDLYQGGEGGGDAAGREGADFKCPPGFYGFSRLK